MEPDICSIIYGHMNKRGCNCTVGYMFVFRTGGVAKTILLPNTSDGNMD